MRTCVSRTMLETPIPVGEDVVKINEFVLRGAVACIESRTEKPEVYGQVPSMSFVLGLGL